MFKPSLLSAAQLTGVKMFGARVVERDGVRIEEPAYGVRAVRGLLSVGYKRDDDAMMRILNEAGVSGPGIAMFKRDKMVLRKPEEYGGGLEVRPNIPGITDENLSQYTGSDYGDADFDQHQQRDKVVDDRALVYKLNAIFTDVTTSDKLQISPRRLQVAKRLAITDPAAAAASLGDYLRNNGFPNAKVVAGDYARTLNMARGVIRAYADTIVYKDNMAPAFFMGKECRITYDGIDPDGDPLWTTVGPVKYAVETLAVYQLAIHYGPERVMFILGVETAMLRINIYDEITKEYFTGLMHGYSSLQGIVPMGHSYPSELTAEQQLRLAAAAKKVSPVYVDDLVVGSAVHVSDGHLILNEHTLTAASDADKVLHVCDEPVHESRSVAHDICMIKRRGREAQWSFRQCDVGERVVLCYSVGDTVEFSEVLRVRAVHGEQLVLSDSNILRRGASGAAVVALRDSALLGIFSTRRNTGIICAAFSSATFNIVTDYVSVTSSEHLPTPGDAAGDRTYERMVKRGLLGFLEQISNATAPVYSRTTTGNQLVGLVANTFGSWCTTVNPDIAPIVMLDGKLLTFKTELGGLYTAISPPPVLGSLPNVRAVIPGERVFLFTKSVDGAEVMSSVRAVTHCMSDMKHFQVEDFGQSDEVLDSAVVVAEKDAAVVGQFQYVHVDSYGVSAAVCVSLLQPSAATVPALRLPELDVRAVISELRDVAIKSEQAVYDMARVGDAIIEVVGSQFAYGRGLPVADGVITATTEWRNNYDKVIAALGWQVVDARSFEHHDPLVISSAFIALMFLHDSLNVPDKLNLLLFEETSVDATPVVGEFPFPRPSSTTGSVNSDRGSSSLTGRVNFESESRFRDLETKFHELSKYIKDASKE